MFKNDEYPKLRIYSLKPWNFKISVRYVSKSICKVLTIKYLLVKLEMHKISINMYPRVFTKYQFNYDTPPPEETMNYECWESLSLSLSLNFRLNEVQATYFS